MNIEKFCKLIPKVELHAHLNGSLSEKTIGKLCELKNAPHLYNNWQIAINHGENRSLSECFDMFSAVHALTSCIYAIKLATTDCLIEMENDGVVYLELRSTPREVENKMTKDEYVETIVSAIQEYKGKMITKFLISIDRKKGLNDAEENVELALKMSKKYPNIICGIDLSGDPTKKSLDSFIHLLKKVKESGLGIVMHCGEVPNESEVMDMITFKPDRLGHVTCLHPSLGGNLNQWNSLLTSNIPVEICLTSNIRCLTVPSYKEHHFKYLLQENYPITLCTDDKGVFSSDLSNEYIIAAKEFNLSKDVIKTLCINGINMSFATDQEKSLLKSLIDNFDV